MQKRSRKTAVLAAAGALALAAPPSEAATITIAPNEPDIPSNCFPFGIGVYPDDPWTPFAAFFYRNLPPFELKIGDTLAFDLAMPNDADIGFDIALARTLTNGGTVEGQPFQSVVSNTQTPLNPRGDAVVGNFELRFTAEAPFSFPGGGLIIRFSNPAHSADTTCDQVLAGASSTDSSGFFIQRAFTDADGVSPWDMTMLDAIGAFQVVTVEPEPQPEIQPVPATPTADTDPPQTTITKGVKKRIDEDHVKLKFVSDEPSSSFECKLDKRSYRACTSPKKLKGLDDGRHKFKVRAIDAAGNADTSPAKDRFRVLEG